MLLMVDGSTREKEVKTAEETGSWSGASHCSRLTEVLNE